MTTPIFYGNWFSRTFDNPAFPALTLARCTAKRPALERFINASIETYSRRLAAAGTSSRSTSRDDASEGSAQYQWLIADLAKSRDTLCTVAYWH